jgi:DNA-binding CsgD family transcriptional regulator
MGGSRSMPPHDKRFVLLPGQLASLGLTAREGEILSWLSAEKTDIEIGEILSISPRTVSHTLQRIYRKLGVHSRAGLVARLFREHFEPRK